MDDMKKEFASIFSFLEGNNPTQAIDFQSVLRDALAFFEKMKAVFQEGDSQQQKQMLSLMQEMYRDLMEKMKTMCEKSGMNQEQLAAFCDNPGNFSSDQWIMVEEAKKRLLQSGRELSEQILASSKGTTTTDSQSIPSKTTSSKKGKRSGWIRS